jgi:uncharacterized protein with NAD-binding domain and iron-sulfur cluster
MKDEVLHEVLSELLEEIKKTNINQGLTITALEKLSESVNGFDEGLNNMKISVKPPDLTAFHELVAKRMAEIRDVVQKQPKEVVHEKRVLFFPENRERIYFDFVVKRLIPFLVVVGIAIWGLTSIIEAVECC